MSITEAVTALLAVVGVALSVFNFVLSRKKTDVEIQDIGADVAVKYQSVAFECAEKIELMEKRITGLEAKARSDAARIAELESVVDKQSCRIQELEKDNQALRAKLHKSAGEW